MHASCLPHAAMRVSCVSPCTHAWQIILRASDFAFFLLTGLDKPAYRNSSLIGRPFELYMELFRKSNLQAEEDASFSRQVRMRACAIIGGCCFPPLILPLVPMTLQTDATRSTGGWSLLRTSTAKSTESGSLPGSPAKAGPASAPSFGRKSTAGGLSHRRSVTMAQMFRDVKVAGEATAQLLQAAHMGQAADLRQSSAPSLDVGGASRGTVTEGGASLSPSGQRDKSSRLANMSMPWGARHTADEIVMLPAPSGRRQGGEAAGRRSMDGRAGSMSGARSASASLGGAIRPPLSPPGRVQGAARPVPPSTFSKAVPAALRAMGLNADTEKPDLSFITVGGGGLGV